MATRSIPTVSKRPVAMATAILVPTPSVLDTSTGGGSRPGTSNSPPKPPIPPEHPRPVRGGGHQIAHGVDGPVGGVDVDPGRGVGEARRGDLFPR